LHAVEHERLDVRQVRANHQDSQEQLPHHGE
jgi:hypothetical protein